MDEDLLYKKVRIVFIGCVKEGLECLQELLALKCHVVGIITFVEDMAKKMSGAVSFKDIAARYKIPIYGVKTTNSPDAVTIIRDLRPDLIFVIGWTRLVSSEIISLTKYGCLGMHASLLPKYRGRAPVNWALINNETEWGNSTILLDDGVDTGKVLCQKKFKISVYDTCRTVYDKVALAGRMMIRESLPGLIQQNIQPIVQDESEASVMPKRTPDDGIIDWNKSALELFNWVRALTIPYPGAFTYWESRRVYIWEVRIAHFTEEILEKVENRKLLPGTIISISDGIAVLTGSNEIVTLHELSFENGDKMPWVDFVQRNGIKVGIFFDNSD